MTTIVGDWRRKILVSDSQFSDEDSGLKYFDEKIYPIEGGWLGVAGNYVDADKVLEYLHKKSKTKPKLMSDSSFIKLTADGLFYCGDDLEWERSKTFMSIGSGAMAAEVCLRMGLTAEEAVRWACNVDLKSHEPIYVYDLTATKGKIYETAVSESKGTKTPAMGEGSDTPTVPYAEH